MVRPAEKFTVSEKQRRWWAFQPVRPVAPPVVKEPHWPQRPIDRFILAELEKRDLLPPRRPTGGR